MLVRLTSKGFYKTQPGISRHLGFAFTLIEVMVVLAIVMLLVGISFNFIGRLPSGLLLRSTAAGVDDLLASAQNRALFQGKRIDVSFDPEGKILSIGKVVSTGQVKSTVEGKATFDSIKRLKGDKYVIPPDIEVEYPDYADDAPVFRFFPDGTAAGGEMRISIKKNTISITVSQLTGIVLIKEEEDL